jgi:hypothetical protein
MGAKILSKTQKSVTKMITYEDYAHCFLRLSMFGSSLIQS